jgi:hypothetical protein
MNEELVKKLAEYLQNNYNIENTSIVFTKYFMDAMARDILEFIKDFSRE